MAKNELAYEWPFDEVRVRLEDGTWATRRRDIAPATPEPTPPTTDEESK